MSAHTPGPWHFEEGRPNSFSVRIGADAYHSIRSDSPEADARLIAAAPDLLAALRVIAESWPAHGSGTQNAIADAMAERARAAIAAAEGK